MKLATLLLLLFLFSIAAIAQVREGSISGQIIDENSSEPLIGASVQIVGKKIGAISDTTGKFIIPKLPVGEYSLRCSAIGYQPSVVTNIVVSTGRSAKVKAKLTATRSHLDEMTVKPDYFRDGGTVGAMSSAVIDASEIKRNPGSLMDMQRIVQILPGVANSQDMNNELIVRGGAPFENLTVLDEIEIPSTNHYPNEYNSAGPINMVNTDMIEDVEFSTGGFPARYGDKISSVMKVTLREGDRNVRFASNTSMHFAGAGTLMEGRLNGGRGSWMFSARQSLLEVFDQVVGADALGLTAVPKYWDMQSKIVYDLSPRQKLVFNGIFGDDRILFEGDPKKDSDYLKSVTDSSAINTTNFRSQQYAYGVTLRSLWGNKGYSNFTLATIGNNYNISVHREYTERQFDANGHVDNYRILNSFPHFGERADQSFVSAKFDYYFPPYRGHEVSLGGQIQSVQKWTTDVYVQADTSRYDLNGDGVFETGPIVRPEGSFQQQIKFGNANRSYGYLSDDFHITHELKVTVGVRYDYFSYTRQGNISPRLNLEYQLVPRTTKLKFAVGEYYQTQPFPEYGDRNNVGYNIRLKNIHARNFAAGIESIIGEGLKYSIEGYYKKYNDFAVSEEFIYQATDTLRSEKRHNVGEKYSYGAEFFLQQKQVKNFYGTLSVSWSKTRDLDPRKPKVSDEFPDEYDFPWIVVVSTGEITKNFRNRLNDMPFFVKYPSYILPFSNDMEIGFKYRYQTGKTYTPQEFVTWRQDRIGGMAWSRGAWIDSPNINSIRYPDYSRLDLQWISRYHFSNWDLNTVVAIQNVTNRKNIFGYSYRTDGTKETEYQYAFFPILGVEAEF